jgi:hypothetical protein
LEINENGRLGIGVCVGEIITEKLLVFLFLKLGIGCPQNET